jgi:hypothetical protein
MQKLIIESAINSFQHNSESSVELKPKISGDIYIEMQLTVTVFKQ